MAAGSFDVVLSPPPGLDSDDTAFRAEGRWSDGNNVRFYNGSPQALGGYATAITLTVGTVITDLTVVSSTGSGATSYVVMGGAASLWASSGLNPASNITPSGLPAGIGAWSFSPYGNTLLCSPYQGKIYQYTLGGGAATVIATAPVQNAVVLTARRQVLAFGTNEVISTTFNGKCIRGSDIEDPTNWTPTATNNSFEDVLDDEGAIMAARVIGDYIAVWTSTSLWLGTFLGDPSQTYRWEKVAGGQGVTGPNAACVTGQVATWLAPDLQLWQFTPGGVPAPVPCPISQAFVASIGETSLVRVVALPHFNEIWIFYTDASAFDGRPSNYIAFNQQGQWFRGALPRDAVFANGLTTALVQLYASDLPAAGGFIAAKANVVYMHELSPLADSVTPTFLAWSLTSGEQYLDNGRQRTMIKRLVPDFSSQGGSISLTLYMRDRPQSTAVTKGPYPVPVGAKKVDFRASGMIVSAKFSGADFARFGSPSFDCLATGGR